MSMESSLDFLPIPANDVESGHASARDCGLSRARPVCAMYIVVVITGSRVGAGRPIEGGIIYKRVTQEGFLFPQYSFW